MQTRKIISKPNGEIIFLDYIRSIKNEDLRDYRERNKLDEDYLSEYDNVILAIMSNGDEIILEKYTTLFTGFEIYRNLVIWAIKDDDPIFFMYGEKYADDNIRYEIKKQISKYNYAFRHKI